MLLKSGKLRGKKVRYPDGVGISFWEIIDEKDEECGIGFDIAEENLGDLEKLISQFRKVEPEMYVPDEKYEAYQEEMREKKKKWWYKLHQALEDIGIHFTPFDWNLMTFWIRRPVPHKNQYVFKICSGLSLGPLIITWGRLGPRKKVKKESK